MGNSMKTPRHVANPKMKRLILFLSGLSMSATGKLVGGVSKQSVMRGYVKFIAWRHGI